MSCSPIRWLTPPPAATAILSRTRRPGIVLRVSEIEARVPSTADTRPAVEVATPDIRPSRFSAVRSAVRIDRDKPSTVATAEPASTRDPLSTICSKATISSTCSKTIPATSTPAITPSVIKLRNMPGDMTPQIPSAIRVVALSIWSIGQAAKE